MSARWNANLWFDLSGSTLKKKTPEFIDSLFWWHRGHHPYRGHERKHPYTKILFGTDVDSEWIEDVHQDYVKLCDALDIPTKWRKAIFGGNAERMLFMRKDATERL
jgi:predicted TIM-barrel fold metal-dependent hydrolase